MHKWCIFHCKFQVIQPNYTVEVCWNIFFLKLFLCVSMYKMISPKETHQVKWYRLHNFLLSTNIIILIYHFLDVPLIYHFLDVPWGFLMQFILIISLSLVLFFTLLWFNYFISNPVYGMNIQKFTQNRWYESFIGFNIKMIAIITVCLTRKHWFKDFFIINKT